jgi:hypothetical protein
VHLGSNAHLHLQPAVRAKLVTFTIFGYCVPKIAAHATTPWFQEMANAIMKCKNKIAEMPKKSAQSTEISFIEAVAELSLACLCSKLRFIVEPKYQDVNEFNDETSP